MMLRVEKETAINVWITELVSGSFTQQEDGPSSILLKNGTTIGKARIYGIAVSTEELIVDDGTGSILVRTFETPFNVKIGDPVLVIGKPRMYEEQCYILGEIVKKIDKKWLEIREKTHPPIEQEPIEIVRTLDKGDGANYEEVAARIGEEKVIHLLATGEIFETRPGKIKVLE